MVKKILLIEDEPEQALAGKIRLETSGYEFISAADGEEGLKKACGCKPDLILLDIVMPKMNGYEVCRRLKEDQDTRDIPVIILTASGEREIEKKCLALGAKEIVRKPYDSKELVAKINELFKESLTNGA